MKNMVAAILMLMLASSSAHATAQIPDRIIYQGKTYSLVVNPMEAYFAKHPGKRPRGGMSTALWRGYVATFAIKGKRLVLKDIEIQVYQRTRDGIFGRTTKSALRRVVPRGRTLHVDWFTGVLVLPNGRLKQYVHMGYGSTYSKYILLNVKAGKVTGQREMTGEEYEKFKDRQFEAYKKTDTYKATLLDLWDGEHSQGFLDSFLRDHEVEYTSKFLTEGDVPDLDQPEKPADKDP